MAQLPISGAVISVIDRGGRRSTVAATDDVAARWDELELELGTGPLVETAASSRPQHIADVNATDMNPMLATELVRLGVRAVFTFPLALGSATVGVAGLYRSRPGALTPEAIVHATHFARATAVPAVREALRLAHQGAPSVDADAGPGLRREVHQATGMVSAQLDVSTTEAFARLRAYAIASERSITAVSLDVVAGTLDFLDLD